MAYIILSTIASRTDSSPAEEIDRRSLGEPITIGRSPECDLAVRDIQLSRRHCRLENTLDGWFIEDLGSKNGTRRAGVNLTRSLLVDGDQLHIGNTRLTFYAGKLRPASPETIKRPSQRPVDPHEALAGTVAGFQFVDEKPMDNRINFPTPQPKPALPPSYTQSSVAGMLEEMQSSSWDSVVATLDAPVRKRMLPKPRLSHAGNSSFPRTNTPTDLSLQIDAKATAVSNPSSLPAALLESALPGHSTHRVSPRVRTPILIAAAACIMIASIGMLVLGTLQML